MNKRRMGAALSYVNSFVRMVVNLLYVPILLAGIGKAEYGLYQTIGSIIAYLNIINSTLSAGATRYYCRFHSVGDEDGKANTLGILRQVYKIANIVIIIASFALMAIVRFAYRSSFTEWELTESCLLIGVLALNLMVTMNNTISIATIVAHEDFVILKGSALVSTILQPIAVVVLIQGFPYALAVCVAQLAVNTLLRNYQQYYAKRELGMDAELRYEDEQLRKGILAFAGGIVLGTVADQIFWKTDQLILAYFFGTESVAVYSVGTHITTIYMSLGIEISTVFMPRLSESWHKSHDVDAMNTLFIRIGRLSLYLQLLVLSGFVVFGKDFIRLWAGEGFEDAYWVAVIVMVPFTIDICQHICLTILQVMNRYGFRAKVYVLSAAINIALTIVLVMAVGRIGAAVSTSIAIFVSSGLIMNWYYASRVSLDITGFWLNAARVGGPLLLVGLVGWIIRHYVLAGVVFGWGEFLLGALLYVAVFFLIAVLFSMNSYERGLVKSLTSRLRRAAR